MSMVLNARRLDDVVILDLSGRITMGEGTLVLRERIQKLLQAGNQKFLLNLADVDYIDSSGLGELVSSFTACLLYTSPSPRDRQKSRMPSSA